MFKTGIEELGGTQVCHDQDVNARVLTFDDAIIVGYTIQPGFVVSGVHGSQYVPHGGDV